MLLRTSIPFLLLAMATAQVPEGYAVLSASTRNLIPGGLWLLNPVVPGTPIPVAGLGSDLTGANNSGAFKGCQCVLLEADGRILVGEAAPASEASVDVHELTLAGSTVVNDRVLPIGAPANIGGNFNKIDKLAWLPDGRVLLSHYNVANPALAGSPLAVLDLTTGSLAAVPVTGAPAGIVRATALDPSGQTVFVATQTPGYVIWAVAVPGGGAARIVANTTTVFDLDFGIDGFLLASTSSGVYRFNPTTGSQYPFTTDIVQAMAVDPVSGDQIAYATSNLVGLVRHRMLIGPPSVLSPTPSLDQPTDLAVDPSMKVYGTAMPSVTTYRWQIQPNPRWVPVRGNTAFGLTVVPSPAPAVALMVLALAPADMTMSGIHLLVDPSAIGTTVFLSGPTTTVPLSIPNNSVYAGMHVFAQVLHLENGIPYSSAGLRFAVL